MGMGAHIKCDDWQQICSKETFFRMKGCEMDIFSLKRFSSHESIPDA